MSIKAGLVGLPNVGKSTLFNALTKSNVPAENYAFCTIDPHTAVTNVPDDRLEKLVNIYDSKKVIPSSVSFVDIAGLVKGAASGEGLGNQFLGHIREVDLMLYVLRCFEDKDIIQDKAELDPLSDYEVISTEIILKDLESVAKRLEKLPKLIRTAASNPKDKVLLTLEQEYLVKLEEILNTGDLQKSLKFIKENENINTIPLLSNKNFLIIANLSETELEFGRWKENKFYLELVQKFGKDKVIPVCAKLEYELSQLDSHDEIAEIANMMGLEQSGLDRIIQAAYQNLNLITFFTCGPKEIHAWPILKETTVKSAAGEIHSDLERGFICAEVFNTEDIFKLKTISKLKDAGKVRTEGQTYLVQDGDILNIRFNV